MFPSKQLSSPGYAIPLLHRASRLQIHRRETAQSKWPAKRVHNNSKRTQNIQVGPISS
jgi:hypothetical protein